MNTFFEIVSMLAPAFFAGAVIAVAHVPLGIEVLKRGIIFLDLAVAQFAALGMVTFHVFIEKHDTSKFVTDFGALFSGLFFALFCTLGLNALEKHSGRYQEAIIGSAFVFSASMSILIMAGDPHGSETIKDILSGQILWITWHDLALYAAVFIIASGLWRFCRAEGSTLFYILFALTVPFSVHLIGVYLVFASLILPALATVNMNTHRHITAYVISVLAFIIGLLVSYLADTPSGPAIVMAMFTVSFCSFMMVRYNSSKEHQKIRI